MDDGINADSFAGTGGGIFVSPEATGGGTIVNCVVAGNTSTHGGPDVLGAINSIGHNLIGDDADSEGWIGSDLLDEDPKLNVLGYSGGSSMVMTLQSDSPALDAGDNDYAGSVDQRGSTRIISTVDIGAVEMQSGEYSLTSPFAYDIDCSAALGASLNIDGEDDTPTLLDYSGNTGNEDVFIYAVNGNDEDIGKPITTAEGGTATVYADGTFDYTATDDFVGVDYFTYTTSDLYTTHTGTISFNITDVYAFDAEYSVLKNGYLSVSAGSGLLNFASAASGETIELTEVNGSSGNFTTNLSLSHGTLYVYTTGAFTFTPASNYTGDQTFTVTYDDGIDEKTTTVTLHVTQVLADDAEYSVVHDETLSVPSMYNMTDLVEHGHEANSASLTVVAINGDENAISEPVATAMGGTITAEDDGSFVYDPPANFAGDDFFSYTLSNGSVESTATIIIHVTNNAPTFLGPMYPNYVNTTLTIPNMLLQHGLLYYASDSDGDTLSVVGVNDDPDAVDTEVATEHGHVTVQADGSFVYVPDEDYEGDDTFTVMISDGITTIIGTITIHMG